MRSLNFGVLVVGSGRGERLGERRSPAQVAAVTNNSPIDVRSGHDLAASLRKLGFGALVVPLPAGSAEGDGHGCADSANTADHQRLEQILQVAGVDACMLALHGNVGGSGRIQAALTRMGVPFVGPDAERTARAYDKLRARACLSRCNLPVPTTLALEPGVLDRAPRLGWPALVKPRFGSQSRGHVALESPEALADVLNGASGHRDDLEPYLVERLTSGVELQVVMLDGEVLGAMQVERSHPGSDVCYSVLTCPPELSSSTMRGVENLARHAAHSLGLGLAPTRIDLLLSMRHNEVVLEVEPLPPLHADGVVALVARAAGLSHADLVARAVHRMILEASPRARSRERAPAMSHVSA